MTDFSPIVISTNAFRTHLPLLAKYSTLNQSGPEITRNFPLIEMPSQGTVIHGVSEIVSTRHAVFNNLSIYRSKVMPEKSRMAGTPATTWDNWTAPLPPDPMELLINALDDHFASLSDEEVLAEALENGKTMDSVTTRLDRIMIGGIDRDRREATHHVCSFTTVSLVHPHPCIILDNVNFGNDDTDLTLASRDVQEKHYLLTLKYAGFFSEAIKVLGAKPSEAHLQNPVAAAWVERLSHKELRKTMGQFPLPPGYPPLGQMALKTMPRAFIPVEQRHYQAEAERLPTRGTHPQGGGEVVRFDPSKGKPKGPGRT